LPQLASWNDRPKVSHLSPANSTITTERLSMLEHAANQRLLQITIHAADTPGRNAEALSSSSMKSKSIVRHSFALPLTIVNSSAVKCFDLKSTAAPV